MGEDDKLLFPERAVAAPPARKRTNTYDIHQPERMLIILLFPTRIMAVRANMYKEDHWIPYTPVGNISIYI